MPHIAANVPTAQDETKAKRDALVKAAEQALDDDLALDFDRPLVKKSRERPATVERLLEACRAGHARSCWIAAEIAPREDQARLYETVAQHCRDGDLMSCRALPDQLGLAEPAYSDLPGVIGRGACLDTSACDIAAAKAECEAGFGRSCFVAALFLSGQEREQLELQKAKLYRIDCAAGISHACGSVDGATPDEELGLRTHLCRLDRGTCVLLRDGYDARRRPLDARDSLERSCQYGNSPKVCAVLGAAYLDLEYEEPVPGRGQALVDDACRKLGTYAARVDDCKRASK